MQGLADGYFVLPYTIGDYLSNDIKTGPISVNTKEFEIAEEQVSDRIDKLLNIKGDKSVDYFHKRLGKIMWEFVGMARNNQGLEHAIREIKDIRNEFWKNVNIPGDRNEMNSELEKAGRVADFLELGELFAKDALERTESAGGHFREESQTEEGEALRNDKDFTFTSAWEFVGEPSEAILHKEHLEFKDIELKQRSYK